MEPQNFQSALRAARSHDRTTAFRLMRQVLVENPAYVPAWIELSKLVEDSRQQRECFERALAIDPNNEAARDGLERLRLKEMLATFSVFASAEPKPVPRKLGEYLLEQGIISDAQLRDALSEQYRRKNQSQYVPLGEILLQQGALTIPSLAQALVGQQQSKQGAQSESPQRLGEYLVAEGVITPKQLEAMLMTQIQLRQNGRQIPLGELLIRSGYLTAEMLDRVLEQQRTEFYSCFMD